MAQLADCLTLNLSSGLQLRVVNSSCTLGSTLGVGPTLRKKKNLEKIACMSLIKSY